MGQTSWRRETALVRVEPHAPALRAHEVRVAVHAAGVNPIDWKMRRGGPMRLAARVVRPFCGPRGPFIPGAEFAGVVEAVGPKVRDLKAGARVAGGVNFARGQHGSYADT